MRGIKRFIPIIPLIFFAFFGCGKNPTSSGLEDLWPRSQVEPLENEMFGLINSARADEGLSALTHDSELRIVAYEHSEDMYLRDTLTHYGENGETVVDRCDEADIDYNTLGENLAKNSGFQDPVARAHDDLMNSPVHRDNILSDEFNAVGVGIATDGEVYYFTQVFANLASPTRYFVTFEIPAPKLVENPWSSGFETFEKAWQKCAENR